MVSALAAQWQGGFCQRTCMRCSCAADSGVPCASIMMPDVRAANGIIQGIDRVMFPPPVFEKGAVLAPVAEGAQPADAAAAAGPAAASAGAAAPAVTTSGGP